MPKVDARFGALRTRAESMNLNALRQVFMGQRDDVAVLRQLIPAWDARLVEVMFGRNMPTAAEVGRQVAAQLNGRFDPTVMTNYLTANAEIGAERINKATRQRIAEIGIGDTFLELFSTRSKQFAASMAGMAINFGAKEGATAAGAGTKTWQVNSGNPRSSHAVMSGETVPIGESFSNGMEWPGDPEGGAAEVANCSCSLVFS